MPMAMQVIEAHQASYSDPLQAAGGTLLMLDGRDWNWQGHRWLWACAPDGREGWVPASYLSNAAPGSAASEEAMLVCDYNALELTVKAGDKVMALEHAGGWVRCQHGIGEGWLPADKLIALDADTKKAGR